MHAEQALERAREIALLPCGLQREVAAALLEAQAEVYEGFMHDWHDMPIMEYLKIQATHKRRQAREVRGV